MKKAVRKALSLFLTAAMCVTMLSGMTVSAFAGSSDVWDGSADTSWYNDSDTSFEIGDAAGLAGFASLVNEGNDFEGKTVTLTSDIYLNDDDSPSANEWIPISRYNTQTDSDDEQIPFKGTFDGDGHFVYNMYIDDASGASETNESNALFGYTAGTIENVGVTGSVDSYRRGAGIAGTLTEDGVVTDCFSAVEISANGGGGRRGSAGIVGTNFGEVSNCINRGTVYNAYRRAGGIVGYNGLSGSVYNCYNVGAVSSASAGYAGSIAASNLGSVSDCYYLANTAEAGVNNISENGDTGSFENVVEFNTSGEIEGGGSLLDALGNSFKAPASGAYPVLTWMDGYVWDTCTVSVEEPANGTLTVTYKEDGETKTITGPVSLSAGTEVTATYTDMSEGFEFTKFTAETTDGVTRFGSSVKAEDGVYTASTAIGGDTVIGASVTDTFISVYTQIGDNGALKLVKEITWDEMNDNLLAGSASNGYLQYGASKTEGGAASWSVLGAEEFITVDKMLELAGISAKDTDIILASDDTGFASKGKYSGFKSSQTKYKFYPGASSPETPVLDGAYAVPAGLAVKYGKASVSSTASAALEEAVSSSVFDPCAMIFAYGSSEDDYSNIDASDKSSSVMGKRLVKGVTKLIVQSDVSSDAYHETASVTAAELDENSYNTYSVTVEDGTVNVAATGLRSSVNPVIGGEGYWAGIKIPVGSTSKDKIMIGSNFEDMAPVADSCYADGAVSYYWDTVKNSLSYVFISLDGGETVYGIPVNCTISQNVLEFGGYSFSLADLKAKPTTAEFIRVKGEDEEVWQVTGITVTDIIKAIKTKDSSADVRPAGIIFSDSTGYNNNGTPVYNADYSWDDVMISWDRVKKSDGTSETGLKVVINGSASRAWIGGVCKADIIDADVSINGVNYTKETLAGTDGENISSEVFKKVAGETTDENVTGVKISTLMENGIIAATPASVTFADNTGFSGTADNYLYGWDDVMICWDPSNEDSPMSSAVNGSRGKLWVNNLYEVKTADASLYVNDFGLSTAQLKAYAKTKPMSMLRKDAYTEYSMTGITVADIIENYLGGSKVAGVTFPEDVKADMPIYNSQYDFEDIMICWSMIDEENKQQITSGFRTAVDRGPGNLWWSGVTAMTTTEGTYTFDGRVLTAEQAGDTLASVAALATPAPVSIRAGEAVVSADDFAGTASAQGTDYVGLYKVELSITPAGVSVVITDDENEDAVVAPQADGSYIVEGGHAYSYKVSKTGYTPVAGNLKVALGAGAVIAADLKESSGGNSGTGGSTGGSTGGTTKPEKDGDIVFSIYTQDGANGSQELAAEYTLSELRGLATKNRSGFVYQYYYDSDGWQGVVATSVVKFSDLFADAGVSFKSGDSLKQAAPDGFSTTISYKLINENRYFFDPANNGARSEVPHGLAIEWDTGNIENGYSHIAEKAYYSGKFRYVLGTCQSLYDGDGGFGDDRMYSPGYRLGTGVDEVTVIKNADITETTGRVDGKTPNQKGDKEDEKTVEAEEGKTPLAPGIFKDVPAGAWFSEAVNFVNSKGLMTGTASDMFSPSGKTTRGMLMTILARLAGENTSGGSKWYQKGLDWAVSKGVSDGTDPSGVITREQLAAMLYRNAGSPAAGGDLSSFTDAAKVSSYAEPAVKWAVGAGIINGKGNGILDPKGDATRAEMAAMIQRYVKLSETTSKTETTEK